MKPAWTKIAIDDLREHLREARALWVDSPGTALADSKDALDGWKTR